MAEEKFTLTDDNKAYILLNVEKKSLKELAQYITGDPKASGLTVAGRTIREFIAQQGLTVQTTKHEKLGDLELTEEQKLKVMELSGCTMKPLEITRAVFNNDKITNMNREYKAVFKVIQSVAPNIIKIEDQPSDDDWAPPTSVYRLIPIVNSYISNPKKENEPMYNIKNLQSHEERNLRALLSYMQVPRFEQEMKKYKKQIDRRLFESTFIGLVHDKPDLLREEREQYLSLSSVIVTTTHLERYIQVLENEIDNSLGAQDAEIKRLSMGLIEALDNARDKLEKNRDTETKLISKLTGSRAERMKGRIQQNTSIINLVDAWKDEAKRKEFIELAMKQKLAEKDQVGKLSSMERVVALIAGLTEDELTN